MIEFKCTRCGMQLRVADEAARKRGKCTQCGTVLIVPEPALVTLEAVGRNLAPAPRSVPNIPPIDGRASTSPPQTSVRRKHRLWMLLLVLAAVIASPFSPKFPLWLGIVLIALCLIAFVPGVQLVSQHLLKLNPVERWRSGFRVATYSVIGLVLILAGTTGAAYKVERQQIAAKQVAEKAERQRLVNEANTQLAGLVADAEAAWKAGDSNLADEKLDAATDTPHATDRSPIRRLRTRMANMNVEALIAEATNALETRDIDTATVKVAAALAVPLADALDEAQRLHDQLGNATDPDRIHAALMALPDEAFQQLLGEEGLPLELLSGFDVLDSRVAELAKSQIKDVVVAREHRRQDQLERERAAIEAARIAEEKRIEQERIAAEAARRAENARLAQKRAEAKAEQAEARKKRISRGFSGWNGSHIELTKIIKKTMNDPDSYDHAETVYWDQGDHLIVRTTFRGKNSFGGVVVNWVKAKCDLDGRVTEVIEWGS